jgi:hypothetical protein
MKNYHRFLGVIIGIMVMIAGGFLVYKAYQLRSPKVAGEKIKQPNPVGNSDFALTIDFKTNYNIKDWEVIDQAETKDGPSDWQKINSGLLQDSHIQGQNFGQPLEQNNYAGSLNIYKKGLDYQNYDYDLTFIPIDSNGVGTIVRYQNSQNYYRVLFVNQNSTDNKYVGPFVRIDKIQNGQTKLLYAKTIRYEFGKSNNLKVRCSDSKIEVYLNNNNQPAIWFTDTNNPILKGSIGLFVFDERVIFEQIKVSSIK